MTAGKNRVRLAVEQMEDRCTPSNLGGGLAPPSPALHGGPQAEAAARVLAAQGLAFPVRVAFRCSVDFSSRTVSSTGFGTGGLGRWTALGHFNKLAIDPAHDRGVYRGIGTLVTARGDQLFYTFTTSWRLSTGKGTHSFTCLGGTGRFAGASGRGFSHCVITADPASPTTLRCHSWGSGSLVLPNAVPITLSAHVSSDGSGGVNLTGVGSQLGRWTGRGVIGNVVHPAADRIAVGGTATITAANGDQLFASFSASWKLPHSPGVETITITGGTGRFAGATGRATLVCHPKGDPASPLKFECNSRGSGILVFAQPR